MTNMRGMWRRREANDTHNGSRVKKDVTLETLIGKSSDTKTEGEESNKIKVIELNETVDSETETLIETEQQAEIRKEAGKETLEETEEQVEIRKEAGKEMCLV